MSLFMTEAFMFLLPATFSPQLTFLPWGGTGAVDRRAEDQVVKPFLSSSSFPPVVVVVGQGGGG